ncbi:Hpt domain-containing protein [Thermodesulfobacteriota bacterium]
MTIIDNEMQAVIQEFTDESRNHSAVLNKDLLTIEELISNNSPLPEDLLNEIFRAAHTIKGTSSFLGFNNIFKLMHSMETLLDEVRQGNRKFESHIIDLVFESFDILESLLDKVEAEGDDEMDINAIIGNIKTVLGSEDNEPGNNNTAAASDNKPEEPLKKEPKKIETKDEKIIDEQIVNVTLGDEFLFSNTIMKHLELLDEMDILKQKNAKNNVFEAYIEKGKFDESIESIKGFGDILLTFMVTEENGEESTTKIENETMINDNAKAIYCVIASKQDYEEVKNVTDCKVSEVFHYKESILHSMPPKERDKFLKEFIDNTEAQMELFSNSMIKLEENPTNEELINEAFRSMHTIKGSAGFIGMTSFGITAHKIENIMSMIREGDLAVEEEIITLLLEGLDTLATTMTEFKNDPNSPTNLLGIQKKLDKFVSEHEITGKEKLEEIKEERRVMHEHQHDEEEAAKEAEEVETSASEETGGLNVISDYNFDSLKASELSELKEYLERFDCLYKINYTIIKNTPIKSMKAALIETKLEKEGIILKSIPTIDDIVDNKKETSVEIIYTSSNDVKNISEQLSVDQISDIKITPIDINNLKSTEEEKTMEKTELNKPQAEETTTEQKPLPEVKVQAINANDTQQSIKPITTTTVRVDIDKLDSLMNLAGELVITKARFAQLVSNMKSLIEKSNSYSNNIDTISSSINELQKNSKSFFSASKTTSLNEYNIMDKSFTSIKEYIEKFDLKTSTKNSLNKLLELEENTLKLGKISSDLQNGIMQTRMVPVENVFSRFKRVVRDLSKSLKKDVKLEIHGEETELDKKIIDELADPLTHMIRNSMDHGVESSEERRQAGKPETGHVSLSAYHKGNHICIEVADDGKGINIENLVRSSIEKGIITESASQELSEKEKLDLIFCPGFSMAKEITGVSGRGVGMDVVNKMIESINGSVDINTKIGEGTTFVLNIPLTLAIIQALLIVISEDVYAIPLESVIEIIKVNVDDIYHIDGGETIKLRGHALSIIDLRNTIRIREIEGEETSHRTIVVVSSGNQQLGIVIDSLIGEQEIVIKSLSEHFSNVKGIVGASVLGDGTISLILDVQTIINLAA